MLVELAWSDGAVGIEGRGAGKGKGPGKRTGTVKGEGRGRRLVFWG